MDPPEVLAKFLRPTNTTQMTRSGSFTSRRTPFGGGPQRLDPLKSARYAMPVAAGALTPILDKEGHRYHGARSARRPSDCCRHGGERAAAWASNRAASLRESPWCGLNG